MAVAWQEQTVELGEVKLRVQRGGSGRPVLVLHHDIGTLDRLPFYDALAEKFDVIVPNHPGFGVPERPQWLRWRRGTSAGWCWSARWASSRPRASSSTRRSSATSIMPAPGFTTRR